MFTTWISGQITDMNEKRCTGGMFDKTSSLNHGVILRNHNIMSIGPGRKLASSSSPKVIYKRRRDSSASRTDRKMPVLAPVPLLDTTREKGEEAVDYLAKLCNGKLGSGLKTKDLIRKETPEGEGKDQLEGEKHVEVSINSTYNGSQEGTTATINGWAGKEISDDHGEKDGKVEIIPESLICPVTDRGGKKLLVLDLNGLLVDIRQENGMGKRSDFRVNGKPGIFFISIIFVPIYV
jgi:hypothetical protein